MGRYFKAVDGVLANNIAMWDGIWHSLGYGVDGFVQTMKLAGSDLYVGGDFQQVDSRV